MQSSTASILKSPKLTSYIDPPRHISVAARTAFLKQRHMKEQAGTTFDLVSKRQTRGVSRSQAQRFQKLSLPYK